MFKKRTTGNLLAMSAVIVCVCFAMLLGTTFAWFTDTASTKVNTINSGKFDIQLIGFDNAGAEKDLNGTTIKFVMADGSTYDPNNTYWEPGATFKTEEFVIRNAGNYALKFKVDLFSNATATQTAAGKSLLDVITFKIGYYDANGVFVDSGYIVDNVAASTEFKLLVGEETENLVVIAHMDELAGNDYQELSISDVAINITATQLNHEFDSNGNVYDSGAQYQ